jgi:hypothetical protein
MLKLAAKRDYFEGLDAEIPKMQFYFLPALISAKILLTASSYFVARHRLMAGKKNPENASPMMLLNHPVIFIHPFKQGQKIPSRRGYRLC